MAEPNMTFSKQEVLAVLQSLLDHPEEKIPVDVVREKLSPYLPVSQETEQLMCPHIDQLSLVLQRFKDRAAGPSAEQT